MKEGLLMRKIIISFLLVILIFTISACKKETKEELDFEKIYDVIDHISLLPEEITLADQELLLEVNDLYETLKPEEKALVTNYPLLEEALASLQSLIAEKEAQDAARNNAFLEAEEYLLSYIPDVLTENITLPRTYNTSSGEVMILWSSSKPQTLSHNGITNPGRKSINVTLTTTLRYNNDTYSFTKKVKVERISFKALPQTRISFGYMYNRPSFSKLRENEEKALDVVNYAFGTVYQGLASLSALSDYQDVLALRKQGVRVVLCLGGYQDGAAPFSEACRTEAGRNTLARSIVEAVELYHYDGVDIDWEYPGYYTGLNGGETDYVKDSANYTAFMIALRRELKQANPDYILSAALPGGPYNHPRFEVENLASVLDFFHLMTYDMDSATVSTHLTPLYSSSLGVANCSVHDSVNTYISRGVAPSKLVIGIAFYGRKFYLSQNAQTPMKQNAISRETVLQNEIKTSFLNRIESGEVIRYFDNTAKAPYLFDTVNKIAVTYDDPESIMYKAQYAISRGLGGMMFWEYGEDQTGVLLAAIYEHYIIGR